MLDLGTVRPGSTIRIPFSTFDKDDGSAITMTNFAVADILIYKDGGTTERASTSGFTATTDFDAKTGKHMLVIDLADNTTAGFYSAGSEYLVAIDSVTVDAVTVGAWVARFRIGYQGAWVDTTIATLSSQTSFTLTAGPAEDDALNGMWLIIHDVASAVQCGRALILDYTGSTKTVTLVAGTTYTAAATDNVSVMGMAPLQPTTLGATLDVTATGEAGLDWGNMANKTTTNALTGTTIAATQQVDVNTIKTQTVTAAAGVTFPTSIASPTNITAGTITTVTTLTGHTPQTGDAYARLGAPAGASVSADVAAVKVDTAAVKASHIIQTGTATAGAASTITIQTALGADSLPVGCLIAITGGTGIGQCRVITAYVNATKVTTVGHNWTTNPDATSVYYILNADAAKVDSSLKVAGVVLADTVTTYTGNTVQTGDAYARLGAPAGASVSADVAAINTKTTNLPAAPASTTNITAGTITTVTNLTNAPTAGDLTATMKASINTEADTALSDYGALKPTTAGRTLDVTATGEAGIDLANIGSPTTVVNLSGTTIKTATDVETDTQDIQSRLPAALTGAGNIKADSLAISGDTTAADNAESFFDGTGYAGTNNVIPLVTTTTTATNLTTNNDKTGYALTSGERDSIAAALLDLAAGVETGVTVRNALRGFAAALLGKASGAATTTVVFRNVGDTKNVLTATVDASGNRTSLTRDLT